MRTKIREKYGLKIYFVKAVGNLANKWTGVHTFFAVLNNIWKVVIILFDTYRSSCSLFVMQKNSLENF